MIQYLITILLLLSNFAGSVWAIEDGIFISSITRYQYLVQEPSKEWKISKGSETYTLDEFVKSGKFCEWRGGHKWISVSDSDVIWAYSSGAWTEELHKWQPYGCSPLTWFCFTCHRCRQKVQKTKTVEELEP